MERRIPGAKFPWTASQLAKEPGERVGSFAERLVGRENRHGARPAWEVDSVGWEKGHRARDRELAGGRLALDGTRTALRHPERGQTVADLLHDPGGIDPLLAAKIIH